MDLFYENNGAPFDFRYKFMFLPNHMRGFYYWLIMIICIVALIINLLAIRSTVRGKQRFVQKTCVVSLAISDIFGVVMAGIANLEELSHEILIWNLGKFMCGFAPMANGMAIMASSLILSIIALDRYQNVMSALTNKWSPSPVRCIGMAIALGFFCCVISYPIFSSFELRSINLISTDPHDKEKYILETIQYCGVLVKERMSVYFVIMAFLIFFPMLLIFTSFYLNIAMIIWKHRKPVSSNDNKVAVGEDTSTLSTKRSISNESQSLYVTKKKNIQVERKMRTFRTVLLLMISFIVCRLPYWSFYVVKLVTLQRSVFAWNLHFSFIALNLTNCILDPLLYTFLDETISALKIINDFFFKICCCCFSNDFEDFEKNNPFVIADDIKLNCNTTQKPKICVTPNQLQIDKF